MEELDLAVTAFALEGPARPQAADGADGDRDRARRRDGQRHVRPDRLDRQGVRLDLHRVRPGLGRRRSRGKSAFDLGDDTARAAPTLRRVAARRRCASVPEVAEAEGGVDGEAQLIGDDGKAIVYGGAPNLGFSIANGDSPFNPLTLVEGAWPKAGRGRDRRRDGRQGGLRGRRDDRRPGRRARSSSCASPGIVKFGSVSTIGGATLAGFDLPTAQRLFDKPGKLDEIAVAAKPGVTDRAADRRRSSRSSRRTRRSGRARAGRRGRGGDERVHHVPADLPARVRRHRALRRQLRDRELALDHDRAADARVRDAAHARRLAPPGARARSCSRRSSSASLASVTGLFLGLGLAKGLFWLFDVVGFTLPNSGLRLRDAGRSSSRCSSASSSRSLASLRPAFRATRVPPIAAVREGATLPESRFARFRVVGSCAAALGFAALAGALRRERDGAGAALPRPAPADLHRRRALRVAARAAARAPSARSDLGRGAISMLVWPFWTLPFWLLRYGAFGPARPAAGRRVRARAVLNPLLAADRPGDAIREPFEVGARVAAEFPGVLPDRTMNRIATQNRAQPAADGVDRRGADDRPRARDARVDARRGHHLELRGRRQRHLHVGLRDHGAEQLQPDPDRRRRGGREGAGRRGDRERARRRGADLRQDEFADGGRAGQRGRC